MHLSAEGKLKSQISWTSKPVMVQRETWKLGAPSAQCNSFSLKPKMSFIQLFEYLHFHSLCNFKHFFQKLVHSGNV